MEFTSAHILRALLIATLACAIGLVLLQFDAFRGMPRADAASGAIAPPAPVAGATAQPGAAQSVAAAAASAPAQPTRDLRERGGVLCAQPHRVVTLTMSTTVRSAPAGRVISRMPTTSKYMGTGVIAWVQRVSADGRWGLVSIPWATPVTRTGWIALDAGIQGRTSTLVLEDLSDRSLTVYRGCSPVFSATTAIGRPGSPSPTGKFWVTDRIAVPSAQRASFGSFAFGLSAVQTRLPRGWTGGNQLAIHGTGAPGSIGQAASAGCLRVSESTLRRLKPLLRVGTPVVIQA